MSLKNLVQSGSVQKPINMILHGVHKIGKTTFARKAPSPIFITGEEIEEVAEDKLPKCKSWDDVLKYTAMIRDEEHNYKTLVIDTVDSFQDLLFKKIVEEDKNDDMATARGGYGKSYTYAKEQMMKYRDEYLVPIRENKKMNIILLCHSTKNKVENPMTQSSYDMFEMKLHKNGRGDGIYTVFCDWVSIIAFANFEVHTVKDGGKQYAVGEGERVMHLTPKPFYDAGNRFDLPDEMALDFPQMEKLINNFYNNEKSGDILLKEVLEKAYRIKNEQTKQSVLARIDQIKGDEEGLKTALEFINKTLGV